MTTQQRQPPTPSEVPFRSPLRSGRPQPISPPGPSSRPDLSILTAPDPEQIFPGFGAIGHDLDLQLVQPSIQKKAEIDAFFVTLIDRAQADPTFRDRLTGLTRLVAASSLAQGPPTGQVNERMAIVSELLEHSPETITLPESLQSHLQQASPELIALKNDYASQLTKIKYVSDIINLTIEAYRSGELGERPTVDTFVDWVGVNENVDLTAADRELMVRTFTAVQSADVSVIPELPLTPEEIEGTLRQVGPRIELTTYGHLTGTVAEMRNFYRSLEAPELPPGMTGEEFNDFLEVAGYNEEGIEEAKSLRGKVREFREQINLEAFRSRYMQENLPDDPIALENLLKEARYQKIQSIPTLHLFYPFVALAQYWDKPLAGSVVYYTAPQTIERGIITAVNSTGLQVSEDSKLIRVVRGILPTNVFPSWLDWGYDSSEDYEKYQADWDRARAAGVNSWIAHRFAFDEWGGHWFQKLLLETAADPLSYIGVGLLTPITKPLGPIGRGVMNLERSWNSGWDAVFLASFSGVRKIGGRTISIIADEASREHARLLRSTIEVAVGRQSILSIPIEKSKEVVVGLIRNSVNKEDGSRAMTAGRLLTMQGPIDFDGLKRLGTEIYTDYLNLGPEALANTRTLHLVDDVLSEFLHPAAVKTPISAQVNKLILHLGVPATKEVQAATKSYLIAYREGILSSSELFVRGFTRTGKMLEAVVLREKAVRLLIETSEVGLGKRKWSRLVSSLSSLEHGAQFVGLQKVGKLLHSIARTYLYFGAYGIMNVAETMLKAAIAGHNPFFRGDPSQEWRELTAGLQHGWGLDMLQRNDSQYVSALGALESRRPDPGFDVTGVARLRRETGRRARPGQVPRQAQLSTSESWKQFLTRLPGELFVGLPGRYGSKVVANHMTREFRKNLLEANTGVLAAIHKVVSRSTYLVDNGFSARMEDAARSAVTDRGLIDPEQILTMSENFTPRIIHTNDIRKIIATSELDSTPVGEMLSRALDENTFIPQYTQLMARAREMMEEEMLYSPFLLRSQISSGVRDALKNPPQTRGEFLVQLDELLSIQQLIPETTSAITKIVQARGTKILHRARKRDYYDHHYKIMYDFLASAETDINKFRSALVREIGDRGSRVGFNEQEVADLLEIVEDIQNSAVAYHKVRLQQGVVERALMDEQPPGPQAFDGPWREWWDKFYAARESVWESYTNDINVTLARIYRKRLLMDRGNLPDASVVRPQGGAATLSDVARLFQHTPDQATSSFFRRNGMMIPKTEWVTHVQEQANVVARTLKADAVDLGYDSGAVGKIYDEAVDSLRSSPDFESGMAARTTQLEDLDKEVSLYLRKRNAEIPENFNEHVDTWSRQMYAELRDELDGDRLRTFKARQFLEMNEALLVEGRLPNYVVSDLSVGTDALTRSQKEQANKAVRMLKAQDRELALLRRQVEQFAVGGRAALTARAAALADEFLSVTPVNDQLARMVLPELDGVRSRLQVDINNLVVENNRVPRTYTGDEIHTMADQEVLPNPFDHLVPGTKQERRTPPVPGAFKPTKLWHASTVPGLDLRTLQPGHDGMLHLHTTARGLEESFQNRNFVNGYMDVKLEDLPTLPDLGGWNPFAMMDEFIRLGLITEADASVVRAVIPEGDDLLRKAVSDYSLTVERLTLEDMLVREGLYSTRVPVDPDIPGAGTMPVFNNLERTPTTEELYHTAINHARDNRGDAGLVEELTDRFQEYQVHREVREVLYNLLQSKGIRGFKYINEFEFSPSVAEYSVGIIDTSILTQTRKEAASSFAEVRESYTPPVMNRDELINLHRTTHKDPRDPATLRSDADILEQSIAARQNEFRFIRSALATNDHTILDIGFVQRFFREEVGFTVDNRTTQDSYEYMLETLNFWERDQTKLVAELRGRAMDWEIEMLESGRRANALPPLSSRQQRPPRVRPPVASMAPADRVRFLDLHELSPWQANRQTSLDRTFDQFALNYPDYDHRTVFNQSMKFMFPFFPYETHRLWWLGRFAAQHPGSFGAYDRYTNYTEEGYLSVPGSDVQFHPFRGTIFNGATMFTRRDYPDFYDRFPVVANLQDQLGRFGFFPNSIVSATMNVAGQSGTQRSQYVELLPPWLVSPLEAFVALNPDNAIAAALQDSLLPGRIRDFYVAREVSNRGGDGFAMVNRINLDGIDTLSDEERGQWRTANGAVARYGAYAPQIGMLRLTSSKQEEWRLLAGLFIENEFGIPVETQRQYRRAGVPRSEYLPAPLTPELRDTMRQIDGAEQWMSSSPYLRESQASRTIAVSQQFYDEVRRFREDNITPQKVALDALFQTGPLNGGISYDEWLTRLLDLDSSVFRFSESLKASDRYSEALITHEERVAFAEQYDMPTILLSGIDNMVAFWYEIQPEEVNGSRDWETHYFRRRVMKGQLTASERELFDPLTNRNDSPLQRAREQDYEIIVPYFDAQRTVFRSYSDEDKLIIQQFLDSDSATQRARLREEEDAGGSGVVAGYQTAISDLHTAIRTLQPEIDARLVLWGVNRISSTRSESATLIEARLRREYGLERDEVLTSP